MSSVLTARVEITGTRPIMWHKFGPESIPLEKQERTGVAGNDPTEWKKTVLCTKDGQLFVRPDYVFSCLCEAAKYTKKGRGSIQKMVAATLQVTNERVLLDRFMPDWNGKMPDDLTDDPDELVYLDIRGVRNPSTGGRNVRYRVAASTGWKCGFDLVWDATIVSREQMQAVCIDAGRLVGLADGRGVGFGRFEIDGFEIKQPGL